MTYVGELTGAPSERAEAFTAELKAAGIPAQVPANIRSVEWSKAVIVAGGFGVGVLTRTVWSESMEDPDLTRAFLSLAREAAAIAKAEGVEIADFPGVEALTYVSQPDEKSIAIRAERVRKLRAEGGELDRRSSIVQDLLSGRPLEADFIFDDLVRRARKYGVPAPRLELVRDLARGIDASVSRSTTQTPKR
jgi:2-dehydropantoate 2-reductase